MKKKQQQQLLLIAAFSGLLWSTSCVQNDYDLSKKVDMTMKIGGSEFAIPGGSTDEIRLGDHLKISNNSSVKQLVNGDYVFIMSSSQTYSASYRVADIALSPIDDVHINTRLENFQTTNAISPTSILTGDLKPGTGGNIIFKISNIPAELIGLQRIKLNARGTVRFEIPRGVTKKAVFNNGALELPAWIVLGKGYPNNKVTVPNGMVMTEGKPFEFSFPIEGLDLTKLPAGQKITDGRLTMQDHIGLKGQMVIKGADIYPAALSGNFKIDLFSHMSLNNTSGGNVVITGVTSNIRKTIDFKASEALIQELPDFLQDDEVRLDVRTPQVFFSIDNQSPIHCSGTGTIASYVKGKEEAQVRVSLPDLQSYKRTNYHLVTEKGTTVQPNTIVVPTLPTLVNKIPEKISFKGRLMSQESQLATVETEKTYEMQGSYVVSVPFVFGENLKIVYKDTIAGWQEDMKKIEGDEPVTLHVSSNVVSKVPLNLLFEAVPLTKDEKGNHVVLEGITATVTTVDSTLNNVIPAGEMTTPTTTAIVIELTEQQAGKVHLLDGIQLRAVATGKKNTVSHLNSHQSIRLTDVRIVLKGGVVVNFN